MPNGGSVTITIKEANEKLHIQIIDQGIGIPHSIIKKIGDSNFTPVGSKLYEMIGIDPK